MGSGKFFSLHPIGNQKEQSRSRLHHRGTKACLRATHRQAPGFAKEEQGSTGIPACDRALGYTDILATDKNVCATLCVALGKPARRGREAVVIGAREGEFIYYPQMHGGAEEERLPCPYS